MKFSENWLRETVRTSASHDQLVATLTAIGLEVESVTTLGAALDGVVVARIIDTERHPEADRLRLCRVDAGLGEALQIVCNAANARAGLKAPLAMIGARVGDLTIKAAKLRGVESNGMLCSAKELGIDTDDSGLFELPDDAPLGTPLGEYLDLPDRVIELGITPNRGDCFSLRGVAFDVAAATGSQVEPLAATPVLAQTNTTTQILLEAGERVPRFVGRVIENVDAATPTPLWMAQRLRRSGIRPISFLVDVTQYVMLDLGQPMHAFDQDTLQGPIVVRPAREGEQITLLDGRSVVLDEDFLLVCDSTGGHAARAVTLGGIMGGYDTRVTDTTRNVLLEAAHWIPSAIIGRPRRLGLHTDAGHRFERGVDPELPRLASEMATRLIADIAGGAPGPVIEAVLPELLPQPRQVSLRSARLARVLGVSVPNREVERIMRALGLDITADAEGWQVRVPTRRFDLAIEEDLIEEIARIHGYDAIPATLPASSVPIATMSETVVAETDLRRQLVARDYLEAINYAFVDTALLSKWHALDGAVSLANPLSAELAIMRTRLLPGLTEALAHNLARQQTRVRLFELGKVFRRQDAGPAMQSPEAAPLETLRIAAVACGDVAAEQWGVTARAVDFHDLKGDLETLAALAGARLEYRASQARHGHPGRSADVYRDGVQIGWIGQLHPRLQRALDVDAEVIAFELDLTPLRVRGVPRAAQVSRYPTVRRDLAFVVPDAVQWAALETTVKTAAGSVLRELRLFDRYTGSGVEAGLKSFAIGLILQEDSRTLADRDVDHVVAAVVAALQRDHAAAIRG